ncbi:MAG: ABC transporter ATP-binding protein/permease [Deltaproteobacteria bacterium]|jgi:ATP-binding cassette subfamily B protein|nr:ABC transporter ATP-binding protein/permease [Deltaproteobacteria bacterium]
MISKLQKKYALSEQGAIDLIKACLASFLHNISLIIPVGLLFLLIKDFLTKNTAEINIVFYALGIVVCLALCLVTAFIQYNTTFFATYVESGVRRVTLAEHLRQIPLSYFGQRDLADLTSTIMADCAFLEKVFSHYIPELIGSIMSTVFVSVGLLFFEWRMAMAALWVIPVALAIVYFSGRLQRKLSKRQMKAKMALADGIQECLETIRDLKACQAEEEYLAGLDKKIKEVEKRAVISEFGMGAFVVSAVLVLKLGLATVVLTGSFLFTMQTVDILTFFMFLMVVSRLYDPLLATLQNLMAVMMAETNIERMRELLNYPIQIGEKDLTNEGYDIVFDRVSFAYNSTDNIIQEVSFSAKQGEVTALVGPSGSGKTTVSRLAARFWDISGGKITIGGQDISKIDPETLLSLFAIVFQDVILFDDSILENIRLGKKGASDQEVMAAARQANCDEFAEKLPETWQSRIGENGLSLSGGERQRISIARAFLKNAPIILLDEATATLDVENETLIQTALSRLIKDKTVLVIAHRLRTVAGADKIVVLENGRVIEQGLPTELMETDSVFRHLAELQTKSGKWLLKSS